MKTDIPWMQTAYQLVGTKETPGSKNNDTIMKWARLVEVQKTYTADSVPWCGLFTAFCLVDNGITPVKDPLWALNWNRYGTKLAEPCFGAIMAFSRNGGGHVGFYVSEDADYYHILGGNQSDMVCITKVAKSRCVGYRWPAGMEKFRKPGRIKAKLNAPITTNEQ